MIDGTDRLARVARRILAELYQAWEDENGLEPRVTTVQTRNTVVIEAESFNTEAFTIVIAQTRPPVERGPVGQ